jgi:streptomycin 6-kinase
VASANWQLRDAFDATQHLLNCVDRLRTEPVGTIRRLDELLGVDSERVRLWIFARLAAEPRDDWRNDDLTDVARAVARKTSRRASP